MMRAVLALFYILRLFPFTKCTVAMQLDVGVRGTPDSGFLMKPFYPVLNDTSLQEWPLVVLPGLHSLAATYGPFAARSDSLASKLFTSAGDRHEIFGVQYVGNYAISAHLSTDVLTILQPRLQVVFHMGHAIGNASTDRGPGGNFEQIRQLCAVMFIQKDSEELMSTCIMDVTNPETLCVASAVLPYHWWHPTLNHSASVYYSVFSVGEEHHCAAVSSPSGIKVKTYESFADSAREKQSYVGPVNLSASLANYEELREDQHLLMYVPTTAVSSRSVFHVPMKLQAESDLQIFVVRIKCRNGLRVLGADVSGSSSWQITVDVNQKRRSATVTASTADVDADKRAQGVQELFSWLIEVDGPVEDGDRGRIVFTLEYEMTRSRKGVYAPVRNKAVAFVTFQRDSTLAVLPVVKTSELVNTALLSERIISWPMRVYLLTHTGRATDITMQSTCHSQDERALKVSVTCDLIYFDGTEVRGASKVGVVVKHGANIRTVNFRVWIPQLPLDVFLSDAKLSAVRGWKIASPAASIGQSTVRKGQNGTTSECSNLRFQTSLIDVYARFVLADERGAMSYLLDRKAQFLVTDIVRSLLQVADEAVAHLRNYKVIDGVKAGQTSVQVVQKSGRVIGSRELIVANDRVDVTRLNVDVVSGLSLSVSAKADFPGALSVHVTKTNLMHHRYQEALLDLTVWFSDGTSLPLNAVLDSDYSLLVETLNKDVVMLAPPHLARLITITAVSPGSGDLVRVSLGIDSTCTVVKRRPLVSGFASVNVEFDEMVQNDASYYHYHRDHDRYDPDLYSGPFLVSRDRIVYSHSDRSRKGRRRKGKGRLSASGRGRSSAVDAGTSTTEAVDGVVPHVEAQHQRHDPVVAAPHKQTSSLELALYILLAVFSVSVVIFAANCLLFVVRRGRKQKLADPKDPVLEARDWVWIGPATLERNDVITSCGRRLMSDVEFSSNQSSRPNSASIVLPSSASGSNRNSTVSTYRGSECSVRITANPLADDNGNIVDAEPVPPLHPEEYFLDEAHIACQAVAAAASDDDGDANIDETDDEEMKSTEQEMTPRRSDRFIRPLSSAWSTMSREDQLRELEEAVASGLSSDWDCEGFGMTYAELMEYFDNLRESTA